MMLASDFLRDYQHALDTQNWDNVAPLIHNDACVTFSDGTVHRGKAEVQAAYEKNFSLIKDEEYIISNVHWVRKTSRLAVYLFDFSWSGIIDNKLATGSGRGTTVIIQEDGKWLLLAEHLGPGKK